MQKCEEKKSIAPKEEKKEEINVIEENEKNDIIKLEKEEEIKVKKKSIKRNPFVKTIDDSISIINSINLEEVNKYILTFFTNRIQQMIYLTN
jgi:hypothetical protein